jgi:hypothetical protein
LAKSKPIVQTPLVMPVSNGDANHPSLPQLGASRASTASKPLAGDPDLVNQVLEVTADAADEIHILCYALPPD